LPLCCWIVLTQPDKVKKYYCHGSTRNYTEIIL
jgi:hypothetical protein